MKKPPLFFCIILFLTLFFPFILIVKAQPTITYNSSGTGTITVTGTTTNLFWDLWNASNANGWNEVFNNQNNDTQFQFDCKIRIGNSVTSTDVSDMEKQVTFSDIAIGTGWEHLIEVTNNAKLTLGTLTNVAKKISSRGCQIIAEDSQSGQRFFYLNSGSELNIYSSVLDVLNTFHRIDNYGTLRIYNSLLTNNIQLVSRGTATALHLFNTILEKDNIAPWIDFMYSAGMPSDNSFERLTVTQYTNLFFTQGTQNFEMKDVYARGIYRVGYLYDWNGQINLTNWDTDNWDFYFVGTCTGEVYRQYEFDLTVQFPNGTKIENASVVISHSGEGGGTDFNGTTDANGEIPLQTLTMGFYNQTGGNSIYSYNPYLLNITYGENWVYESTFNLTDKTTWLISLVDPSAKIAGVNIPILFVGVLVVGLIIAFAGYVGYKKKKS